MSNQSTLSRVIHYPDTNSVEATWVDSEGNVVRCHSYSDRQMQDFLSDLGNEVAPEHLDLIDLVTLNLLPLPPEPELPVPPVSAAQFRLALLELELIDDVEAYVAASASRELKLNWEFRLEFEINHPLVIEAQTALEKTDDEMKALFALASTK